ncbi:MAG: heme ABC transporter ATP-binding protein [Cyclobacteriaceae bacterium]|nr:heme ABC transporter ATP-binding protein [Cyclobacteriaceae bacterium]MCH8515898.1 heme ABC transporter ATP-binding protein [Cyclobacteriaceae bacterium]
MILEAQEVSIKIGGKTLLRGIDLSIKEGEFWTIAGCNGAGKSTLIRALSGDLHPTQGKIMLKNRWLTELPSLEMAQMRAVLTQHNNVNFSFKVRDLITLGLMPHGIPEEAASDKIAEIIVECGLEELQDRSFESLSGGEQQRAHLARVLLQVSFSKGDPLLLLDEPTSALDIAQQHRMLQLLSSRVMNGLTVIAIIHDLNLAAQYADHILFLKNGETVAQGRKQQMMCSSIIEKTYGQPVSVWTHPTVGCPYILAEPCPYHHEKVKANGHRHGSTKPLNTMSQPWAINKNNPTEA